VGDLVVQRRSRRPQRRQVRGWVAIQQRPHLGVRLEPHDQRLGRRVKPDDVGARAQQGTVLGAQHDPPAGRDDRRRCERRSERRGLEIAEARLALLREDLRDTAAGRLLDQRVGVAQRPVEPRRQQPPDRRLARSTQADEDNGTLLKHNS
jgi:hypothetical protein